MFRMLARLVAECRLVICAVLEVLFVSSDVPPPMIAFANAEEESSPVGYVRLWCPCMNFS